MITNFMENIYASLSSDINYSIKKLINHTKRSNVNLIVNLSVAFRRRFYQTNLVAVSQYLREKLLII